MMNSINTQSTENTTACNNLHKQSSSFSLTRFCKIILRIYCPVPTLIFEVKQLYLLLNDRIY